MRHTCYPSVGRSAYSIFSDAIAVLPQYLAAPSLLSLFNIQRYPHYSVSTFSMQPDFTERRKQVVGADAFAFLQHNDIFLRLYYRLAMGYQNYCLTHVIHLMQDINDHFGILVIK